MRKYRHFTLIFIFGVLFLFLAGLSLVNSILDQSPIKSSGLKKHISQVLEGLHIFGSGKEIGWELLVKKAESEEGFSSLNLSEIKAIFYLDKDTQVQITSQKGLTKEKNILIEGRVRLTFNNYEVEAEKIIYSGEKEHLRSDNILKFIGKDSDNNPIFSFQTKGLDFNFLKSKVFFRNDIHAEINLKKETLNFLSNEAEVDLKNRSIEFFGNIQLISKKIKIKSDRSLFLFDKKTKRISRISFLDNVELTDRDLNIKDQSVSQKRIIRSNRADFYPLSKKYILSGNPRLTQGSIKLSGEKIIFSGNDQSIKIIKAQAKVENSYLKLKKESLSEKKNTVKERSNE